MKIKLTSFKSKNVKYESEFFEVEVGGVYEVVRQYDSGEVTVKTPNGLELPLFTCEFEIISED